MYAVSPVLVVGYIDTGVLKRARSAKIVVRLYFRFYPQKAPQGHPVLKFHLIRKELEQTMLSDRGRLRARLRSLEHDHRLYHGTEKGGNLEERFASLKAKLNESLARAKNRAKNIPKITFDSELPIVARKTEIAELVRENQVVIVCGETGSGKSTQLPKILLEMGRGITGLIGHTQPRRIAARSVASRIAEELRTPLGREVGYKIRFTDETGPNTYVKLMTDGILLAESQGDHLFEQYETLIIDEAHERSLNIDFLLGILKRLLPKRPELKLIITSATIDAKRFAEHFASKTGPAPVIEVSGRSHPIELRYRPLDDEGAEEDSGNMSDADLLERGVLNAVDELARIDKGDILIFMPSERDIMETAKSLRGHKIPGDDSARKTEILPLYARLPSEQQQKIFKPHPHRRIVIATNVAESSLTVPGIKYVIDPGTARISRYSTRSRTQRLPIVPISRASADQRAGRCGRTGPGICIRLFSEKDYEARERYTVPEIQRTNLASVILQTKALNLGAIEKFPFIDPPKNAAITDGYKTLFELGAVDDEKELTETGRRLARLPVDPRIGKMILAAGEESSLREILIIAAALEIQDPRERPFELREKADGAHAKFLDEKSDFVSYLKIWDFYNELKDKLSRNQLRKACVQNFLSFNRMKEWSDIHVQLLQLVREAKLHLRPRNDDYDAIHKAILAGLLSGISNRNDKYEYETAGGGKFNLWPGSGLFSKKYHWIVSAERIETTRRYLRCSAKIETSWIEPLAPHLIQRSYLEPHWSKESGYVHAYERLNLFGLTIVPKRRVNYGPIDPVRSRTIFISEALLEQELDTKLDFFIFNLELREEANKLESKLRRHDFLKDVSVIADFYEANIPEDVYDRKSLEKWYGKLPPEEREKMRLKLDDICNLVPEGEIAELFPETLRMFDGSVAKLEYRFTPGEASDGLSVVVPLEGLSQLDPGRLGWLVPGLLERKIVALLRTLPKDLRKSLVPITESAKELMEKLESGEMPLEESLARAVTRRIGRAVVPEDFEQGKIAPELRMNIKIVEDDGAIVSEGRELATLRKRYGIKASEAVAAIDAPEWNREGLKTWDFGDLPESLELKRANSSLKAFPAIIDSDPERKCVSLRLLDSLEKAELASRGGLLRLFLIFAYKDIGSQVRWFPQIDKLSVYARMIPGFELKTSLGELMGARSLRLDERPIPRNETEFKDMLAKGLHELPGAVLEITKYVGPFLEAFHAARLAVERNSAGLYAVHAEDAARQIDRLLVPGFLLSYPWKWLKEFPRYFKAIPLRFEKLKSGGRARDVEAIRELEEYWERYSGRLETHEAAGLIDPELGEFRRLLEEYRVSIFAQQLGTAVKISPLRLEKQWEKTRK